MKRYTKLVLEKIEKDLSITPSLEQIAMELGTSSYALSRCFKNDLGETFSCYVKRRKMAEAARQISFTNRRILDIALDYGYSSQEAFQRVYKKIYLDTPRLARFHHSQLLKRSALECDPIKELKWEEHTYGPMELNAIGKEFNYSELDKIGVFWREFHHKYGNFGEETYGISLPPQSLKLECFHYLIGIKSINHLEGFIKLSLPKKTYIVFEHIGSASHLMNSFNYIWGKWLFENQRYEVAGLDFELYPKNYDPNDSRAKCFIFLPVIRKD